MNTNKMDKSVDNISKPIPSSPERLSEATPLSAIPHTHMTMFYLKHEDTRTHGHCLSICNEQSDDQEDGLNSFEAHLQVSSDVYKTYQFRINLDGCTVIPLRDFVDLIDAKNYAKTQYLFNNNMYPYVDDCRPWFPVCKDIEYELKNEDFDDINYIIIVRGPDYFSSHSLNWSSMW